LAFGLLCRGEARLALGDTEHGMRLLDEAMVAVAAGEVSPVAAGILYCAVIEACVDALDLRRAAEWTDVLERWCDEQSGVVPYRGACLVHRAQVLQSRGAWDAALSAAAAAHRLLATNSHPAVGSASYQLGELHRLRGDFADAMSAYRQANDHGREPTPGMLLLRVAEGRADAAVAAVDRMLEHSRGLRTLPTMLAAAVEVLLAAGQRDAARLAADELESLLGESAPQYLRATADFEIGCVRLADGEPREALSHLRRASVAFGEMDVPFESARARVQMALAYRALDDHDAAEIELEAARSVFHRLGARPELERIAMLSGAVRQQAPASAHGLTGRECEVLRQVATGATNRQVAADLHISEHTVARHLQNIFAKLGVSSRAAATAFAHAHDIVERPGVN
jgi:DNA-binding NarL/FixJ family response regulator